MTDDSETAVDVLADAHPEPKHCAMLTMIEADSVPGDLDYDDWIKPMRITDGRVCIEADHGKMGSVYYTVTGLDNLISQWDDGTWSNPTDFREDMRRSDVTLTPVLRGNTPFGGDGE